MYKVGDEVLVKGAITDLHEGTDHPYFVAVNYDSVNWVSEDKIIPADKTYADGLSDAWELARRLYALRPDEREEMFKYSTVKAIIEDCTIEEVMDCIEAYEKEKEIKVGDVVEDEEGTKALVIDEGLENTCFVFTENGCVEDWYKVDLKNTGKKILIGDLLRQIGE